MNICCSSRGFFRHFEGIRFAEVISDMGHGMELFFGMEFFFLYRWIHIKMVGPQLLESKD